MRITVIRKNELTRQQIEHLTGRLKSPEHEFDGTLCSTWDSDSIEQNIYIVIHVESSVPIGILYRDGPRNNTTVAWWLDNQFRGERYGSEMIELLAQRLKAEGVTGIARIPIVTPCGKYHDASSALVRRLKKHFTLI